MVLIMSILGVLTLCLSEGWYIATLVQVSLKVVVRASYEFAKQMTNLQIFSNIWVTKYG